MFPFTSKREHKASRELGRKGGVWEGKSICKGTHRRTAGRKPGAINTGFYLSSGYFKTPLTKHLSAEGKKFYRRRKSYKLINKNNFVNRDFSMTKRTVHTSLSLSCSNMLWKTACFLFFWFSEGGSYVNGDVAERWVSLSLLDLMTSLSTVSLATVGHATLDWWVTTVFQTSNVPRMESHDDTRPHWRRRPVTQFEPYFL